MLIQVYNWNILVQCKQLKSKNYKKWVPAFHNKLEKHNDDFYSLRTLWFWNHHAICIFIYKGGLHNF